jgi:hypothetical protein
MNSKAKKKKRLEQDFEKMSDLVKKKLKEFGIKTWDELEKLMG